MRVALDIVEAAASTQNGTRFGAELLDTSARRSVRKASNTGSGASTAPPRQSRCFSLLRAPGKDFDERDLSLLGLLRPHLACIRARWTPSPAQLTERERDVLELLASGLTNREIAQRLFISPGTVRKHLEHVYEKLGIRSRAGAVAAAFRNAS